MCAPWPARRITRDRAVAGLGASQRKMNGIAWPSHGHRMAIAWYRQPEESNTKGPIEKERTTCNRQLATCNVQCATCDAQRATWWRTRVPSLLRVQLQPAFAGHGDRVTARPSVARLAATPTPTPPCMRRARGLAAGMGRTCRAKSPSRCARCRPRLPACIPLGPARLRAPWRWCEREPSGGAMALLCTLWQTWAALGECSLFSTRKQAGFLRSYTISRPPAVFPPPCSTRPHPCAALGTATRSAPHVGAAVAEASASRATASSQLREWWLHCAVPGGVQRHMPDGELEAMQPGHPCAVTAPSPATAGPRRRPNPVLDHACRGCRLRRGLLPPAPFLTCQGHAWL